MTTNIHRFEGSDACILAASALAADPDEALENVLMSTPDGRNVAATPNPDAVRSANSATPRPLTGNDSTRIHAANVYPPRPLGHGGGCVNANAPAVPLASPPTPLRIPSSPAKSKNAEGPSRFAATRSVRSNIRRGVTPTLGSRSILNTNRK
eukprot:30835-Pelagococcus_subviridis.AAC.17